MGQRFIVIDVQTGTTAEQAIDMAFDFAQSLRKTGWEASDERLALSLWIDRQYGRHTLSPYLRAGFRAGFQGAMKPTPEQVDAQPRAARDLAGKWSSGRFS